MNVNRLERHGSEELYRLALEADTGRGLFGGRSPLLELVRTSYSRIGEYRFLFLLLGPDVGLELIGLWNRCSFSCPTSIYRLRVSPSGCTTGHVSFRGSTSLARTGTVRGGEQALVCTELCFMNNLTMANAASGYFVNGRLSSRT